jgi:integrase
MRGSAKLFLRYADGKRKSVVLPYAWVPGSARDILTTTERIAELVATGLPLPDAADRLLGKRNGDQPAAPATAGDEILFTWERFGLYKVSVTGQVKASTWVKDYTATARRLRELAPKMPTTAKQLLGEVGQAWEPGSRSRQIAVRQVAAMLLWGVDENLLKATPWTPPQKLTTFIGTKTKPKEGATPLLDEQILSLLDGLPTDPPGRRWRFAIGLCSVYGLRPIELLHLSFRPNGDLWCDYRKRSGGGLTAPRKLEPFHEEWAQEWEVVERLRSGDPLPPLDSPAGPADTMRKYLIRQDAWLALKGNTNVKYTPYSFRHGYALRLHQQYPRIGTRIVAALMGHSHDTHLREYGQWTDAAVLEDALNSGRKHRINPSRSLQ